jgi:predicted ester cyclase
MNIGASSRRESKEMQRVTRNLPPFNDGADEQSGRPFDQAEYNEIKELWLDHIAAEHRGDIPGLQATLTDDCVYTILNNGKVWNGHEGAAEFYDGFLTAFPENCFSVVNAFIGPQGVVEEAHFNGINRGGDLLGIPATGQPIEFDVVLMFPWDREKKLFKGERIYFAIQNSLLANIGQILRRVARGRAEGGEQPT